MLLSVDMLLSAVSDLVVAQSSSEIPEGLMNNPVYKIPKCNSDTTVESSVFLYHEVGKESNKHVKIFYY